MVSNFEKIEAKLNCKFPAGFKDYISLMKKEEVVLELFDGDYRILYSLTKEQEISDWREDVIKCSAINDANYYPEDKGFKKLPFARALSGGGYKYLYFICKAGEESNGEIYIRNIDAPHTGRIRVSQNMELIKGEVLEVGEKGIVNCKNKSFTEIIEFLTISNNIGTVANSFGVTSRENKGEEEEKIDLRDKHAIIFIAEEKSKSWIEVEINFSIFTDEKLSFSSKTYEIDIVGLDYQIENNINSIIFYHKFICSLNCLKTTIATLISQGDISMKKFNQLFNLTEFIKQVKEDFNVFGYGSY